MKAILVLSLMLGSLPAPGAAPTPAAKPNILFIVGDNMGYADVG